MKREDKLIDYKLQSIILILIAITKRTRYMDSSEEAVNTLQRKFAIANNISDKFRVFMQY